MNEHRAWLGKSPLPEPDFSIGAKNFAELLVYGPGGSAKKVKEGFRHIPSHDPDIRRAMGLRPGGIDDAMGALNQEVARFDNRLIKAVHQVIGGADDYVDISKDGSGIYASGGNRGYLMWKQVAAEGEVSYGAKAVRSFLRLADVKRQLLNQKDVELLDARPWQTDMLLHLPKDTQSGKKLVPTGYYYFGSISNGAYATLKPLAGGDVFDGISVAMLLAQGLHRVDIETI